MQILNSCMYKRIISTNISIQLKSIYSTKTTSIHKLVSITNCMKYSRVNTETLRSFTKAWHYWVFSYVNIDLACLEHKHIRCNNTINKVITFTIHIRWMLHLHERTQKLGKSIEITIIYLPRCYYEVIILITVIIQFWNFRFFVLTVRNFKYSRKRKGNKRGGP